MLKYHLKQEQLDFLANSTISPESLVADEPEELAKGMRRGDIELSNLDTLLDRSVAEDGDELALAERRSTIRSWMAGRSATK